MVVYIKNEIDYLSFSLFSSVIGWSQSSHISAGEERREEEEREAEADTPPSTTMRLR